MRTIIPWSICLLLSVGYICAKAQNIQWNTTPSKGFVYQITNSEAQYLLTSSPSDDYVRNLLHTLVDTFDVRTAWVGRFQKGHFLLVHIAENKLYCNYTSISPFQVFLLKEYDALTLQVVDKEGNVREDARVKFKVRRLPLDPVSKTYRITNEAFYGTHKFVTVELEGFLAVFDLNRHEVPSWYNRDYPSDGPDFFSYLITDKNKYKPAEKVRFKSYALSGNRSPLRRDLDVFLSTEGKLTKVGSVAAHRPGGYAGEFLLHDSLDLRLNKSYGIRLLDQRKRIVASSNFRYEDYELNGNQLEIKLTHDKHYYTKDNRLSILATDVNGLILKGARASILVAATAIQESFQRVSMLPDTLMFNDVDLNSTEPTWVNIPSSLFKKTNTSYMVHVTLTNSENMRIERSLSAKHFYSTNELTARLSNDSIVYEMMNNGVAVPAANAVLKHDIVEKPIQVSFPYREKINPVVSSVYLRKDSISREIQMRSLPVNVDLTGGIRQDSFSIRMNNPQKLQVKWYIYQGSQLIHKGYGQDLNYATFIDDRTRTYYAELLYTYGGQDQIRRKEYEFKQGILDVVLDIPERVYPGQDAEALIRVTDQAGNPVSGVDLTAVGVNAKLGYHLPDLPDYRSGSLPRTKRTTYSKNSLEPASRILPLDYDHWRILAGLDTMMFYKFSYPGDKIFRSEVPIPDSTQFAPYVFVKGNAKKIYVIEIDRVPVHYSWTHQPSAYAFYVPPGKPCQVTLRLHDRVLILDSLVFTRNKKTILSFDVDHLPAKVTVKIFDRKVVRHKKYIQRYYAFTETEKNRYLPYVSGFQYESEQSHLASERVFVPLSQANTKSIRQTLNVGPIPGGLLTYFDPTRKLVTTYNHTGGFSYSFEDNIVYKTKGENLLPEALTDEVVDPMQTINDKVTTLLEFYARKYKRALWHPRSIDILDTNLRLSIRLPWEKAQSGVANVLFEDAATHRIIAPCSVSDVPRSFHRIPLGLNNLIVLYNNGSYLKVSNVLLQPHHQGVINLEKEQMQPSDSISLRWIEIVVDNCQSVSIPKITTYRHRGPVSGNIQGYVYDEDNMPIPGVNIVIKGTKNGTVSQEDGGFAIDAQQGLVTLVISFIGYKTTELEVNIGSDVAVYLQPDIQQLSEVVVVAYGASVKHELSASFAIRGMASGVQISDDDYDSYSDAQDSVDAEDQLYQELLTLNAIRSNFSDVSFWQPRLFTDKQGSSSFTIHFPDDITQWEATVYAMNRRLQTGTVRKSIRSYKPIMAELAVPNFLTRGDSAVVIGKISNYTSDKTITGTSSWQGFTKGDSIVNFTDVHSDRFAVVASSVDSISSSYQFTRSDGYLDGERRAIPVVEQGTIRAQGTLGMLKDLEPVIVKAATNEMTTVRLLATPIGVINDEVNALVHYRYDCNEQLASKLIGLISHKRLMQFDGKPFKYEKDVLKIIERLIKNQNSEFLWSWWDVSTNTSYWMSSHILRALKAARDAGYDVKLDIANISRKAEYKFDILKQYSPADIDLINSLASWNAPLDYRKHVQELETILIESEKENGSNKRRSAVKQSILKERLLLMEVRQLAGLPYVTDSLLRYQQPGMLEDLHFTDEKAAPSWWDNELASNVIAYRIIRRDTTLHHLKAPVQAYFLRQRALESWNTYQSSNVIDAVLADLIAAGATLKKQLTVELSGKENMVLTEFPYEIQLAPGEVLNLTKKSGIPAFYMEYVTERVTKQATGVAGFRIETALANNDSVMIAGKPVTLYVEVIVSKDATRQHVMIDVPIPGSCSYYNKSTLLVGPETHREYYKERTLIFCESMSPGRYLFKVELLPRFTGKYNINPAQVSLMYLPVVNANTAMKKIRVR